MKKQNPEDFLPLSQTHAYILASLNRGSKHGYAILKEIDELSEGKFSLAVGNLYAAIKQLLDSGLIERAGEHEEEGERRKIYQLSGLGVHVVEAERRRVQCLENALGPAHGALEGMRL